MHTFAQNSSKSRSPAAPASRQVQRAETLPRNTQGKAPSGVFGGMPAVPRSLSTIPVHPPPKLRLQSKLAIHAPGDVFEQEADRVAEEVVSAGSTPSHAPCHCGGSCSSCKAAGAGQKKLQAKHVGPGVSGVSAPPIVHHVLRSAGRPLDQATRDFFEPRFGYDFGHVRVHTDAEAADSARSVRALAYTVEHNVVFGAGRYSPETMAGRSLLAHELAHVIQQSAGGVLPDRRSEADAEAAATDLDGGRPPRVAMGTQVALARQPSSPTDDSDLYKSFLDMPQIERDRLLSTFGGVAGPGPKPIGVASPEATTPSQDVGCHTDPNKRTPGQSKCTVSHHKAPDEATRVAGAQMHALDVSKFEKEQRDKLDRLNAAYLLYKRTGKFIHRDEFSPYEIEKDNVIATSVRWDEWMNARGVGINNLEAAKFDERYFRSRSEFELERSRRAEEHEDKLRDCKKERGLKWPKASRTRPDDIVCAEKVNAEYTPTEAAAKDASLRWANRQLEQLDRIENAGPVSTAALVVGGTARVISGGDSVDAVPSALALGGLGDAFALGPGAPPLPGTAQDPGRAPEALVEFMPADEVHDKPPVPSGGGTGGGNPPTGVKTEPIKTEPIKTEPIKTEPIKTEPIKTEPIKTEQKSGQKAEDGGRVVAGRPVKPRTATATKYVWRNPRMAKGNFVEADLDANGALTITVKSHGPEELRVGGPQLLDDVFEHFGADKIHEFDAVWVRNSSFQRNYDEYVQNIQKGINAKDAAWNTWTGRELKRRGFTSVEVPAHGENPEIVSPVFRK